MNFSKFNFVFKQRSNPKTNVHLHNPMQTNNSFNSIARNSIAMIPTIQNVPVENKSESSFYDQMIEVCNKNDIKLTHDDNIIGSSTGIGDMLLKFVSIKFKTDCTPFYFNLESFTRPYYSMNPINQLEFRIKLIRELCECNDIPTDMVRFIYSKNPNINAFTKEMYQRMNDFKLDLKLISSNAIDVGKSFSRTG